jgi:hypothetical protein
MDETLFYVGGVAIPLGMALLSLAARKREPDFAPAFAFFGALLGMLFTTSANTDGSITVAYNSSQTIGLWPILYLPIMFSLLALFVGIYSVAAHHRF